MSPNPWEMAVHIRYRTDAIRAELASDALSASLRLKPDRSSSLKRRVGIVLIHLGEQLAGADAARRAPGWASPSRAGG